MKKTALKTNKYTMGDKFLNFSNNKFTDLDLRHVRGGEGACSLPEKDSNEFILEDLVDL